MWRRVSKEAAIEIAKEIIRAIALWAIPPAVALMGWLQNVPWFYVVVGVILSGAGIMTWLVQLDEWRSRKRVEHKLVIGNMRIHLTQANNIVAAIRFGFSLHNTAIFPIKFRIDEMQTKLTDQANSQSIYPQKIPYLNNVITIAPGGIGWFDDHNIGLPQDFKGNAIAELQCKLSYGKADRFDHEIDMSKRTFINFVGAEISGGQHWYDQ